MNDGFGLKVPGYGHERASALAEAWSPEP